MADLQLVKNVSLLADTAWRHLSEDPLLLAVQASRRLPSSIRGRLAAAVGVGAQGGAVRGALAEFLADRPGPARQALASAQPRSRLGRDLAAELAVQLGVGLPPGGQSSVAVRARELWAQGDLSGAVAVLEGASGARHQRARLRSELAAMSPGFRLPLLSPSPAWAGPSAKGPTRVLHVLTNSFPHTQSGYAVRSHAVLRSTRESGVGVRAVTRIGYPVTVGLVGASVRDVVDGIEYRHLLPARLAPTPVARLVQMSRLLAREVEAFRPDVLHTTTNYQNALVVRAVAESYGLPWVYEMRGVLELTWVASRPVGQQERARASERFRRLRAKETEMALQADAVVALSQVQKADLVSRGVPAAKVWVVPNAVEDAVLEAERLRPAEARRRLGLPEEGTWVGSVSSLVPYEGFEVLLRAVARCRRMGLDVRCLLVGDGVSRASLVALAADLGLGEQVCVLPGRVPPGDSLNWYQALDVFCVPRLDTEVCRMVTPIKPLAAMGLGRPVIASDLPALVEVTFAADELRFPAGDSESLSYTIASWMESVQNRQVSAVVPTWGQHGQTYAQLYEELR
ncbi:glycosyltransferase [Actinomyces respiraculi]|uniref:Glycosyltransferase n=2 Tax=Actinomycetaceae TaxID=2049 RepID=A0A7T0LLP0_9ACTO|nr:glycosyltransferase [Actinomyces respiraculi]